MTRLEQVQWLAADTERMARPADCQRVTVPAPDLNRMVARQLALREIDSARRAAVADNRPGIAQVWLGAAEALAAEFGTDVSEWTV